MRFLTVLTIIYICLYNIHINIENMFFLGGKEGCILPWTESLNGTFHHVNNIFVQTYN